MSAASVPPAERMEQKETPRALGNFEGVVPSGAANCAEGSRATPIISSNLPQPTRRRGYRPGASFTGATDDEITPLATLIADRVASRLLGDVKTSVESVMEAYEQRAHVMMQRFVFCVATRNDSGAESMRLGIHSKSSCSGTKTRDSFRSSQGLHGAASSRAEEKLRARAYDGVLPEAEAPEVPLERPTERSTSSLQFEDELRHSFEVPWESELFCSEVASEAGSAPSPRRSTTGEVRVPSLSSLDDLQDASANKLFRGGGLIKERSQANPRHTCAENSQSLVASTQSNAYTAVGQSLRRFGILSLQSTSTKEASNIRCVKNVEADRASSPKRTDRPSWGLRSSSHEDFGRGVAMPTAISSKPEPQMSMLSKELSNIRCVKSVEADRSLSPEKVKRPLWDLCLSSHDEFGRGVPILGAVSSKPEPRTLRLPKEVSNIRCVENIEADRDLNLEKVKRPSWDLCSSSHEEFGRGVPMPGAVLSKPEPQTYKLSDAEHLRAYATEPSCTEDNSECQQNAPRLDPDAEQLQAPTNVPYRSCCTCLDMNVPHEKEVEASLSSRHLRQGSKNEHRAPSKKSSVSVNALDLQCDSDPEPARSSSCPPYLSRHRSCRMSLASTGSSSQDDDEKKARSGYVRQLAVATRTLVSSPVNEVQSLRLAREDELIELSQSVLGTCTCAVAEVLPAATDSCNVEVGDDPSLCQRQPDTLSDRHVCSPLCLRLCGILPRQCCDNVKSRRWAWASANHYTSLALASVAVVVCTHQMVHSQPTGMHDHNQGTMCSDLVVAVGSLIGIITTRAVWHCNLLGSSQSLLAVSTRRQGVMGAWSKLSRKQNIFMAFLWGCSLLMRVMDAWSAGWHGAVSVATFFVTSSIFVALTFTILHVNCCLTLLIDAYCSHFTEDLELDWFVREWNILQAVLRKASGAVEKSFVVLQTTALAAVLLRIVHLFLHSDSQSWCLPAVMFLGLCDGWLIFKSAEVTEKCSRLPSVINSLSFGRDVDMRRHYLVQYVSYSGAGFYVGEVRLTNAMAIKFAYVSGLVFFGVLTKVVSVRPG